MNNFEKLQELRDKTIELMEETLTVLSKEFEYMELFDFMTGGFDYQWELNYLIDKLERQNG